jgi:hypothetical protein
MDSGGRAQAIKRLAKVRPNLFSSKGDKYRKPAMITRVKYAVLSICLNTP